MATRLANTLAASSALWTLVGLVEEPVASAEPNIEIVEQTSGLRGGERARIAARISDAAGCRLVLRVEGREAARSALSTLTTDQVTITWRWRVGAGTGGAETWSGTVHCWAKPPGSHPAIATADTSRKTTGRLHGDAGRPARLTDGRGVVATVKGQARAVDRRPWLQRAADWATVLALLGIAATLAATRRQAQSQHTLALIDRPGKEAQQAAWVRALGFLRAPDERTAVEQVRRLETAPTHNSPVLASTEEADHPNPPPEKTITRAEILGAANYYEEIAAQSNLGKLDDRLVRRSIGPDLDQQLFASWWWVHYEREGGLAALQSPIVRRREHEVPWFAEWERMVRTIRRTESYLRQADTDVDAKSSSEHDRVRALCLPRKRRSEDDAEWEAFKTLSLAVGKMLREGGSQDPERGLRRLEDWLANESIPSELEQRHADRTILIAPFDRHLPERAAPSRALLWLGARLEVVRWLRCGRPLGRRLATLDQRGVLHRRYFDAAARLDVRITREADAAATAAAVEAALPSATPAARS